MKKYFLIPFLFVSYLALAVQVNKSMPKAVQGFIENKGQIHDQFNKPNRDVLYLLNTNGLNVQLKKTGFAYDTYVVEKNVKDLSKSAKSELKHPLTAQDSFEYNYKYHRVDIELVGANSNAQVVAEKPSTDYTNYYNVTYAEQGILHVRSFEKIILKNIYEGIDIEYVIDNGNFKYNFIVHPGADYSQIQLKYDGAPLTLTGNKLQFELAQGMMEERIPKSWYEDESGKTEAVTVSYKQVGKNVFGFAGVKESTNQTLVIDPNPFRLWGTYYGGSGSEGTGVSCTTDAAGNILLSGLTPSSNNIATVGSHQSTYAGNYDAFLVKFITSGVRQWATYFGGIDNETNSVGCATDATSNVFVAGVTQSTTNIATIGSHQTTLAGGVYDAFLVKFNASGIRQWGTYYGGTGNELVGLDGIACSVDLAGNVILAGMTTSTTNISTTGSHQSSFGGGSDDAYLVKFNSSGVRQWGTYYGGTGSENSGISCAVDGSGNLILTGTTTSGNNIATIGSQQPTLAGNGDCFLVKFNSSGIRQWGTYYGGTSDELGGLSCAVDALGNVFLAGVTQSTTNIATIGSHQTTLAGGVYDAFLVKFNSLGVRQWGTYYGGSGIETFDVSCFIDKTGGDNVFLAGITSSANNISTVASHQFSIGGIAGDYDVFLVKFNTSGVRQWGTYYGGSASEGGGGSVVSGSIDSSNNIYLAGFTASANNISTLGSHQPTISGGLDFFLVKLQECSGGTLGTMSTINAPSPTTVCSGVARTFSLSGTVTNAASYNWTVPSGWTIVSGQGTLNLTAIPTTTGTLSVRAYNSCGDSSTTAATRSITVTASPASPSTISTAQGQLINGVRTFCNATTATFTVTNVSGNTYQWIMPSGWTGTTSTTNSITRTVGLTSDTIRLIAISTTTACPSDTQKLFVRGFQIPTTPASIIGNTTVCIGRQNIFTVDSVAYATSYTWTLPSGWTFGSVSKTDSSIITPTPTSTLGSVNVIARNFCGASSARTLTITTNTAVPAQPSAISGSTSVCANATQTYSVTAVSGVKYRWVLPLGWTIQSGDSTNQITVFTSATAGTISVFPYLAVSSICEGTARTLTVSVLSTPNKPGLIFGDTTVCASGVNTYTIASVPNATSYAWSLPTGAGWSGSSSTTSINITAGTTTGNFVLKVRAIAGSCSSLDTSLIINVSPSINAITVIAGTSTICSGSTQQYGISPPANATNYAWTLPSGWVFNGKQDTTTINVIAGSSPGNLTVMASNLGCTTSRILAVTVNSRPSIPSVISTSQGQLLNGVRTFCNGTVTTFSVTNVAGNAYQWTMPSGWTGIASTTNTITRTVGTVGDTIRVIAVSTTTTCPSDTQKLFVRSFQIPTTPTSIIGNTIVCVGKQNTFSVDSVPYATSYTWTLPSGWTFGSVPKTDSSSILPTPTAAIGSLNVVARNFCGASNPLNSPITTNTSPPSQPSTFTAGPTNVCGNILTTYSVTSATGVRYRWVLPSGWSIQSGDSTNQITVLTGTTGGTISVYPFPITNPICEGPVRTMSVGVSITPNKPVFTSGDTTICVSGANTYSISDVVNATSYVWTLPAGAGWSGASTTTSINVTAGTTTGNFVLKVRAANVSCSSLDTSLSINVSPTIGALSNITTANTTICANSSQQYSITKPDNATNYAWSLPNGWTFSSKQDSIVVNTVVGSSAVNGTISVTASNLGCVSAPKTLSITVNASPTLTGNITGSSTVCPGVSTTYSISVASGATSYTWTKNSAWTGTSTTNTISITPTNVSDTLRVIASNGSCNSVEKKLYIVVSPPPAVPAQISGTTTTCIGSTELFRVARVTNATSYRWTYPTGWSGSATTADTFVYASVGNTSGTLSVASVNNIGCASAVRNSSSVTVSTVIPNPPTTINGADAYCVSVAKTYSVPAVTGATGYLWSVPTGWAINSGQNTTSINVTPQANTGVVSVQTIQGGCKSNAIQAFSGNPRTKPTQSTITLSGTANPCVGTNVNLSCASVADADTYTWTVPTGWTINSGNGNTFISATVGSSSGNITVLPKNTGCDGTQSTRAVTVSTPPTVTGKIEGETYVKSNAIRKYYVSGVTGVITSYNWTITGSGWSFLSNTNEDTVIVFSGKSSGSISVEIRNDCGFISRSKQVFAGVSSGLNDDRLFSAIKMYPVPAKDLLSLSFSLQKQANLQWQIVNMLGQVVLSGSTERLSGGTEHELPISISTIPSGVYQLNISDGNATESLKFSTNK